MDHIPNHARGHLDRPPRRHDQLVFVLDQEILHEFVTPQMMDYFRVKMRDVNSETLVLRVCELIKYLILVRFSPGRILFGREIDDVWHYWILQTRQYAQLCEKLPGKTFRHHSSVEYQEAAGAAEKVTTSDALQRILSFFISYYRNFGPITGDRLKCWPTLQRVVQEARWDLDDLNDFLSERAVSRAAPQLPCS